MIFRDMINISDLQGNNLTYYILNTEHNSSPVARAIYSTSQPNNSPRLGDRGIRNKSFLEINNIEKIYTIKSLGYFLLEVCFLYYNTCIIFYNICISIRLLGVLLNKEI
jgi:hypothetical protein